MYQYLYFLPQGGFNDILTGLNEMIEYCKIYNRIILFDTQNSMYKINISDYFYLNIENIIYDMDVIRNICKDISSIYPNVLADDMTDIINGNCRFNFTKELICIYKNNPILLPKEKRPETIIFMTKFAGGGGGYFIFKTLMFKQNIISHTLDNYSQINKPYLCIQVRNTDRKSDYQLLYTQNKTLIHSYNSIYIATDDINVLDYFKKQGLSIFNFTRFGTEKFKNLHGNKTISPNSKILDLVSDIYVIVMAEEFLSNSNGGFIKMCRECRKNRDYISSKFVEHINIKKPSLNSNKRIWLSDLVKIKLLNRIT